MTLYTGSVLGVEPPPDDLDPDYWSNDPFAGYGEGDRQWFEEHDRIERD